MGFVLVLALSVTCRADDNPPERQRVANGGSLTKGDFWEAKKEKGGRFRIFSLKEGPKWAEGTAWLIEPSGTSGHSASRA